MRGGKTRDFTLETGDQKISKGGLNFGLDMRRKKGEPNAKGRVGAKSMKRRNETTIVLGVKDNPIPPGRKVTKRVGVKNREVLLELLLLLGIKATIGQVGQEQFTIHVESVRTNGMMNKDTTIRTRSKPGKDRTSGGIHNHVGRIMDVTLKVLPGRALAEGRKRRAVGKQGRETRRIGKTNALMRRPGRIRSTRNRWNRIGGWRRSCRFGGGQTTRKRKSRKSTRSRKNSKWLSTKKTRCKGRRTSSGRMSGTGQRSNAGSTRGVAEKNSGWRHRRETHSATERRGNASTRQAAGVRRRQATSGSQSRGVSRGSRSGRICDSQRGCVRGDTGSGRSRWRASRSQSAGRSGAKGTDKGSDVVVKNREINRRRTDGRRSVRTSSGESRGRDRDTDAESSAKETTSLAREDNKNRKRGLGIGG
jgi:hypothetical protein